MSNAQRFYLHRRILEKLSETEEDPRKSAGHQLLLLRIQPLLDDLHRDMQYNSQAIERMLDEGTSTSRSSWLETFERRLWILFSTRFDMAQFQERTERDICSLCSTLERVNKHETIEEESSTSNVWSSVTDPCVTGDHRWWAHRRMCKARLCKRVAQARLWLHSKYFQIISKTLGCSSNLSSYCSRMPNCMTISPHARSLGITSFRDIDAINITELIFLV